MEQNFIDFGTNQPWYGRLFPAIVTEPALEELLYNDHKGTMNVQTYRKKLFLLNASIRRCSETERKELVEEVLLGQTEHAQEVREMIAYSMVYVRAMVKARQHIHDDSPGMQRFEGWQHEF